MGNIVKAAIKRTLAGLGYEVHRKGAGSWVPGGVPGVTTAPLNPIPLWNEDEPYISVLSQIQGVSLVDEKRCHIIYQLARQALRLPGEVAEVGVYKGGSAYLMAAIFDPDKPIHLFDTFAGMPPIDPRKDLHHEGDFADTSLESVKAFLKRYANLHFYPGFFPDTGGPVASRTFCMIHIDVDIYQSALDCCRFFYHRMVAGGFMVFDDYGFTSCPGVRAAVNEFFADKPEEPCYLPTGQSVVYRMGGKVLALGLPAAVPALSPPHDPPAPCPTPITFPVSKYHKHEKKKVYQHLLMLEQVAARGDVLSLV